MFANIWADDRQYWREKTRLRRARALERQYIWDLQTEIINATIKEPRDQEHIDSLLVDLAGATAGVRKRTDSCLPEPSRHRLTDALGACGSPKDRSHVVGAN